MKERKLTADVLEVILESANLFDDSVRVRNNDYSGRSMYGSYCFGLVFYAESDMYKFIATAGMVSTERERDIQKNWAKLCDSAARQLRGELAEAEKRLMTIRESLG